MNEKLKRCAGRVAACAVWLFIFASLARATDRKILPNHVPSAVKRFKLEPAGRLAASDQLQLAIGLPLRNTEVLTNFVADLYNPASSQYGQYLTPEEFARRFGPTEEDYGAVIAFAEAQGLRVTARYSNRLLLDVSGSVADIERAFQTTLRFYQHPNEARTFFAPDVEPSLDLAVPVLSVSGLNNYSLPRPHAVKATPISELPRPRPLLGSGPGGTYMGNDFRRAYVPNVSLTGAGQTVGLVEFDGFASKDITDYEALAGISRVRIRTVLLDGFRGGVTSGNVEVALDIQTAISMAPGLAEVLVYEAGPAGNWHDMLNAIATDNLAQQISCSWYAPGAGPDPTADQIFQQMAAQGQSFLNASGDYDAYSGFISFPGATPYITQVGGTTLSMTTNGGSYLSETAWNWNNGVGTGGGFSTNYFMPSWQNVINIGAAHASPIWRNVPDVAMTADNVFVIANNGQQLNVGGTSAAAPLWAGFMALVNQQALATGKPKAGFINPAVYNLGGVGNFAIAFHDIVTGNNTNANSPTDFFAVPGYDLCTGWGAPNGQMTVNALAGTESLNVIGGNGFASGGRVGGPFSVTAQTFTLTNQGTAVLSWQAASNAPWLSVSPASGTLAAAHAVAVMVNLNSAASNLNAGFYGANVWFTNNSSGFIQARQFSLAIAQSSYGGAVLFLNPAAYWPLNETDSVPAADVVSNSGSLASRANGFGLAGPVQGEPGIVGQSFRFSNGPLDAGFFGSHVAVPYHPALNPNSAFTVELWAKPAQAVGDLYCPAASVDGSRNAGNARYGWVLYQAPANWEFRLGGGDNGYAVVIDGGPPLVISDWNHIVGVYDGANASLYVNGQLAAGPIAVSGFSPNTNLTVPLQMGATTFSNRTFDGWVDELAIYPGALGGDRIIAHYNAASSSPAAYALEIMADQPTGYWHLDEPAYAAPGSLPAAVNLGSLGSAANGTYEPGSTPGVAGVPSLAFGAVNPGCQFNGTGYIDLPGWALNFTGPLSLVLWTKPNHADGNVQVIAGKGGGSYGLLLDGSGYPHFADGTEAFGDLIAPIRIDDGAWHQLAGVYDGTNSELFYVDGQLAASTNGATNAIPGNNSEFLIGANADVGLFQLFNGVVDEVSIFAHALSAAQVLQLYSAAAYSRPITPLFQGIQRVGATLTLTWSAVAGHVYQVQYTTALDQNHWNNLGLPIAATTTSASVSDVMIDAQRFYRVLLLQ